MTQGDAQAAATENEAHGSFSGKLAVLTGGGSGMGRELVCQLAARGCSVAACDWHTDAVAQTAAIAQAGAGPGVLVTSHTCDVSDEAQVLRFRDELLEAHSARHVDLVFSNAGIGGAGSFVNDGREEWERTVAFEQYEQHRDQGLPELSIAANIDEEIHAATQDELAIRKFLEDRGILSVPPDVGHYTTRPAPGYLEALSEFGEIDSFLGHTGVRYLHNPSPDLGFFELATTKDPRPLTVHEGVPGHFFQLTLSRMHQDPIRRHFYDSGSIEGLGFYAEEMMMQAGLFDDRPRARELIYSWMRLRALRVEVDVKLALGEFTIPQAADYLQHYVPMDPHTAMGEAAAFAATPGQAIAYQIGKAQILRFLADAKLKQGSAFDLRAFHDYLWKNGNVPIALLRWEYLGLDDDWRDAQKRRAGAIPSVAEPKPVAKGAN